jgi:uncharacterized protein
VWHPAPVSTPHPIGTVASLHRWPVKSMGGEPVSSFVVGPSGVAGDRAHALFVPGKRGEPVPLTAREAPRLLAWSATYAEGPNGGAPPTATLRAPDGTDFAWGTDALLAALRADLGRDDVSFVRRPEGIADLPDSVLVTSEASHRALGEELGAPLDLRRYRTNVHLDVEVEAYEEEGWEGMSLVVGEVTFALLHPCERCVIPARDPSTQVKHPQLLRHLYREHSGRFGINARALGTGRVSVGDPAHLVTPA